MDEPKIRKITDEKTGLSKAEHYCAYQERSQQEVRDKLYEWGLYPQQVESIISKLIEANYLNEERFAKEYTRGKFNQKAWGKVKIKQGLKQKQVPDKLIKKALDTIDKSEYYATLENLLKKKAATIHEINDFKRRYKLQQYAMGRGFESELITAVLKEMETK